MAFRTGSLARPEPTRSRPAGRGRRCRVLALAAVAATGVAASLTIGLGESAQADPGDTIVVKNDRRDDVTVLPKRGAGKVARASIDLRSVALVEETGAVQMTIRLKRILTDSKYTQVVAVQMKPAMTTEQWFLDVSMSGQGTDTAYASYSPDLSGTNTQLCGPMDTVVDPDADTLSVTVPDRCLPSDAAKIRVFSSLTKDSGAAFSVDKLAVRGSYLMRD